MKRNPKAGITQLEVLVSLAIMTIIAVLLANTLNFHRLALERVNLLSTRNELFVARETLRRAAERIPLDYGEETVQFYVQGTNSQLTFFSEGKTELTVKKSNKTLLLNEQPLAENVDQLKISYYGSAQQTWSDTWSDPLFLPELIKIEWTSLSGPPEAPITLLPAWRARHSEMSVSSAVPPVLPSRP